MILTLENLKVPTLKQPDDLKSTATATDRRIWEKRVDEYVKRESMLEDNINTLYSLVWGQCTDSLRARIEAHVG